MRRLVAAGALSLLVGACGAQAKGPATASAAVQVNKADHALPLSRDEEGAALLVDRSAPDTVYLAYSEMTTGACRFSVSTDRGATWRPEAAPVLEPFTRNCAMGTSGPQNIRTELVQGADGTIYDVFQANDPSGGGGRSLLIGRSKDAGRSWQTSPIAAGPASADAVELEINFEGHIAVDPGDPKRIYAMWRRSYSRFTPARPTRPFMSVSDDAGATWSPPRLMFERNPGLDGPRPVVVGDRLFAFWRESAPPLPAAAVDPLPSPPVTRLFASVSTDQGATWADHQITSVNDASEPVPLYDARRGTFHVVWHDNRAGELDSYYASSRDGITWGEPTRLNDDPAGTRYGQYYPQLSMSPSGRLDVAWYDWRDDPFPPSTVGNGQVLSLFSDRGKFASVYMTSSRDGGATWSGNVRVNDVPIDRTIGSWVNNADVMAPVAVASFDAGAAVAWSDTRNGNSISNTQDIFASTVIFGKTQPRRVTSFQIGVVGVLLGLGVAMCLALFLTRPPVPPAAAVGRRRPAQEPVRVK